MKRIVFTGLVLGALTQHASAQAGTAHAGDPASPSPDAPPAPAPDPPPALSPDPPPSALDDDLAKAADATAEVATIPASDPGAAAGRPLGSSSDNIDLGSLGLEPGGGSFDDKLNIYGFADFGYTAAWWSGFIPDSRNFAVGNVNVYLAKNLTPRARALLEIRYTFMPSGSQNADGSFVDTTAQDYVNQARRAPWSGIIIERAYAEYDITDHLTLRGGHWLTPYGVWNTDHGSPVIIAVTRPYIIGEGLFPEHQTGLDLFGDHVVGELKLGFHLTASNGRGVAEAVMDRDNKVAFGGRVEVETTSGLKAGASYYRGRYTGLPPSASADAETYLEDALGGDLQYDRGGLHLQAEAILKERHYAVGERLLSTAGFKPDGRATGIYLLGGYRFDRLWNVMPYAYIEDYRPVDKAFVADLYGATVGLNFRPSSNLVLKVDVSDYKFADGPEIAAGATYFSLATQASWVF